MSSSYKEFFISGFRGPLWHKIALRVLSDWDLYFPDELPPRDIELRIRDHQGHLDEVDARYAAWEKRNREKADRLDEHWAQVDAVQEANREMRRLRK